MGDKNPEMSTTRCRLISMKNEIIFFFFVIHADKVEFPDQIKNLVV